MGPAPRFVVVVVGLFALPALAGAQGLGDASAKEKQRRQESKAPKARTYTQEELATLPPAANGGAPPPGDVGAQPPDPDSRAGRTPASPPPTTRGPAPGRRIGGGRAWPGRGRESRRPASNTRPSPA